MLDCGKLKNDVYCSIVEEPWKMKGDTYVMDVFDFFKKRRGEINVAFKGGEYVEHALRYDYSRTIVLALISRNSSKVTSAILCVEHDTRGGKVWEVIWFATRQRKQNKGFGACLFSISQKVAKKCSVKGILVTATNEVVTWWMGTNASAAKIGVSPPFKLQPGILRSDSSDSKIKSSIPKIHSKTKAMKRLPKGFRATSSPDPAVQGFYSNAGGFDGAPYRYDVKHTTHIWWTSK